MSRGHPSSITLSRRVRVLDLDPILRPTSADLRRAEVKISGLAIHQAPQTCFDTAATDERGADLACIFERSSRPVFE
jgi:hypothetical protein